MAQIEIFRAGTHQPMQGAPVTISSGDLERLAANYDVALHEAPIVAGHPAHDHPAYGWVKGLSVKDGVLLAETGEMDADFAGLVKAGRFKKISASFYTPDSPSNPKPGAWHLRHVGFLGAQPPAVKGLRNASFAGGESGVAVFGETQNILARIFRRMRDSIIARDGLDAADAVIADWDIEAISNADAPDSAQIAPAFTEPQIKPTEKEAGMATENDIAAQAAALKQREDRIAAEAAALEQRVAAFAEKEEAKRHGENAALIADMVKQGRIAPALAASMTAFMDGLDHASAVSFAEGAAAQTPLEYFRGLLAQAGPVIDFGERAAGEDLPAEFADGEAMGRAAADHIEERRKAGVHVDPIAAVAHVKKGNQK